MTQSVQTVARPPDKPRISRRKLASAFLLLLTCLTVFVTVGSTNGRHIEIDLLPTSEWMIGKHEFDVSSDSSKPAVLFTGYCLGPISIIIWHDNAGRLAVRENAKSRPKRGGSPK